MKNRHSKRKGKAGRTTTARALSRRRNNRPALITQEGIKESVIKRIVRLESIHEARKSQHSVHDSIAYWTFIAVMFIGNFVLSLLIIFLLLFSQSLWMLAIVTLLGLSFGSVYERYLNSMSHIFAHHHLFSKAIFMLTAIISVGYIVFITSYIYKIQGLGYSQSRIAWIAIAYFVAYMVPYAASLPRVNS